MSGQPRCIASTKPGVVADRPMLDDDDGVREVAGQGAEDHRDRREPAEGGPISTSCGGPIVASSNSSIGGVDTVVVVLMRRARQRLLAPEREHAEAPQAVIEQLVHAGLQLLVEVESSRCDR